MKTEVAKNLLEDKTCDNCSYGLVEAEDDKINTCWLHADDIEDNYYENFPQENTCGQWLKKTWAAGGYQDMIERQRKEMRDGNENRSS